MSNTTSVNRKRRVLPTAMAISTRAIAIRRSSPVRERDAVAVAMVSASTATSPAPATPIANRSVIVATWCRYGPPLAGALLPFLEAGIIGSLRLRLCHRLGRAVVREPRDRSGDTADGRLVELR